MLWLNFLHLYQPVNAEETTIREATEKSYKRIVAALKANPNIRFTMNISGALLIRWEDLGYYGLIEDIAKLIAAGQIEITGTACYHPLLPLISEDQAIKQIEGDHALKERLFGQEVPRRGFFLPEMAYSPAIGEVLKKLGYEWLILDEISHSGSLGTTDTSKVHLADNGLKIVFRNRILSSTYVPQRLLSLIGNDGVIITASDAELYGLRHNDSEKHFEKLLSNESLNTSTISDFIATNQELRACSPIASSWESLPEELASGKPFAIWHNEDSPISMKLWDLIRLAQNAVLRYDNDANIYWAEWHLVRGLASCVAWWSSEKDFRPVYGPRAWSPDEVSRGLNELIRAIRAIENPDSLTIKLQAEQLFAELGNMIWQRHWQTHWQR